MLTKYEARLISEVPLLLVVPAKAGIQGLQGTAVAPIQARGGLWAPAFAGATITRLGRSSLFLWQAVSWCRDRD
jgi:hypothetical protein